MVLLTIMTDMVGRISGFWFSRARKPGMTNKRDVTVAETGFPGRAKKNFLVFL